MSPILPLTGIRGLAALWVVLHHLRGGFEKALPDWTGFLNVIGSGYLGVDLFAFLSGFVIAHNYGDRLARFSLAASARYLWARLARIYPLHLFCVVLFLIAMVWFQGVGALATVPGDRHFWLQVLLLHGWGFEDQFVYNVPSWTVSSEWFCYLFFPLVAPWLARLERGGVAIALAVATLGATTAVMFAVGHPGFDAYLDWGVARIGGEFFVGCCLQRAYRAGFARELPWGWVGTAALAAGIGFSKLWPVVSVFCFATLVFALAQDRQPLRALFANRPAVWLGEISYSIYMLHWFVLTQGLALVGPVALEVPPLQLMGWSLAAVIAGAALTYRLVERPARRRLRALVP